MKILLFSDIESQYTVNFINQALIPYGWEVVVVSLFMPDEDKLKHFKSKFEETLIEHDCLFNKKPIKNAGKIKKVFNVLNNCRSVKKRAQYLYNKYKPNVVSLQFISLYKLIFAKHIADKCRVVCSFWGSDILRGNKFLKKRIYPKYLKKVEAITFDGYSIEDALHSYYGDKFNGKLFCLCYGNSTLNYIDKLKSEKSVKEIKEYIGYPCDGRATVVIGYNAYQKQNQLKVAKALSLLPVELQKKLYLVFPVMYGIMEEGYKEQLCAELKNMSCGYCFLKEYLSGSKLAAFYLGADVFVHAQETDAYSQSFVNFVYAGAQVIQGKWLHYREIDLYNLNITEFGGYSELPELIKAASENCQNGNSRVAQPIEVIRKHGSVEETSAEWNKLLSAKAEK